MKHEKLFDNGKLSWIVLGRDPDKPNSVIDTNEYIISSPTEVMLLDPGGTEIFSTVLSEVSKEIDLKKIKKFLCTHQDPDCMSSLTLWMSLCPEAKIYLSWLWSGFLTHFGKTYENNFITVADKGMTIPFGQEYQLELVPAHYCHSSGNLNLYDPTSGILFSGDIGGALVPEDYPLFIKNFDEHIQYMEAFHVRWMPSNVAKNKWVKRVRALKPKMLCPQHGSIFKGKQVDQFLDWFEALEVGIC